VKCVELFKLKSKVSRYDHTFISFEMPMQCFLKIVFKVYDLMLVFIW
jgi:hypothetical protein